MCVLTAHVKDVQYYVLWIHHGVFIFSPTGICTVSVFWLLWMDSFVNLFWWTFHAHFPVCTHSSGSYGRRTVSFSRSNQIAMYYFICLAARMSIHWLCTVSCFNFNYFSELKWNLTAVLNCVSLIRNNTEQLGLKLAPTQDVGAVLSAIHSTAFWG